MTSIGTAITPGGPPTAPPGLATSSSSGISSILKKLGEPGEENVKKD
jgi:hypothetical protein